MNKRINFICYIFQASNITCHWNGTNEAPVLSDVSLEVKEKKLLLVTGPVGCGKSSLLLAFLDELPPSTGKITRNGKIVYVPQTAWVYSGTLRDNILFNQDAPLSRPLKRVERVHHS